MDIEKARSISGLVKELDDLTSQYDRCEYFRDNYKYVTVKAETTSPRSGHYYLDIDHETVKALFTKKMSGLLSEISKINERILVLKLETEV